MTTTKCVASTSVINGTEGFFNLLANSIFYTKPERFSIDGKKLLRDGVVMQNYAVKITKQRFQLRMIA